MATVSKGFCAFLISTLLFSAAQPVSLAQTPISGILAANEQDRESPPTPTQSLHQKDPVRKHETHSDSEKNADDAESGEGGDDEQDDGPIQYLKFPRLKQAGFEYQGWFAQSVTWNPDRPANRLNGFQGLNDRANDYSLNQLGIAFERPLPEPGDDYQLGVRFDMIFGSDARFMQSAGFDDQWTNGGNASLAIPQLYIEFRAPHNENLSFQVGRFWTPLGYEGVPSLDRFFLSSPYTYMLAEPSTHLGAMSCYKINDSWSTTAGIVNGWDVWNDNNDKLGFLGTVNWVSGDETRNWLLAVYLGDESDAGDQPQISYSLMRTQELTEQMRWVFWQDFGAAQNGVTSPVGTRGNAQWFGFVNELFYDLRDDLSVGGRLEWFRDDDGFFVSNSETGESLGRGNLFGATLGLNYSPRKNWLIRPEIRQDWGGPFQAFDDFSDRNQFTFGCDVVFSF